MKTWNSRMIRQSANIPGGRLDILFYIPSIAGFTYAGVKVDGEKIAIAQDLRGIEHCPVFRNRDLNDIFICYCEIHNLTLICIKWVPGDPSTIFLATSFTQKMPEGSDSMYSYILMLESI